MMYRSFLSNLFETFPLQELAIYYMDVNTKIEELNARDRKLFSIMLNNFGIKLAFFSSNMLLEKYRKKLPSNSVVCNTIYLQKGNLALIVLDRDDKENMYSILKLFIPEAKGLWQWHVPGYYM